MDIKILEIASNTENNKIIENYTHFAKKKTLLVVMKWRLT